MPQRLEEGEGPYLGSFGKVWINLRDVGIIIDDQDLPRSPGTLHGSTHFCHRPPRTSPSLGWLMRISDLLLGLGVFAQEPRHEGDEGPRVQWL